jgi:hypothetical protein
METGIDKKVLLSLSLPLMLLVIAVSTVGLLYPSVYAVATPNWTLQTMAQDSIDLFLALPVLIVSTFYSHRGNRLALNVWAATNMYIVYTFAIYCFDVKFNALFVFYCFILGLSSFSTGAFVLSIVRENILAQLPSLTRKVTGYFLIIQAALFYLIWLSDIIPAVVQGRVPADVTGGGLLTNPVHVIDLALVLPAVFVIGILILRRHSIAIRFAPSVFIFFILMDLTIAALSAMLFLGGIHDNYSIVVPMIVHSLLSLWIVILTWKDIDLIITTGVWNFR